MKRHLKPLGLILLLLASNAARAGDSLRYNISFGVTGGFSLTQSFETEGLRYAPGAYSPFIFMPEVIIRLWRFEAGAAIGWTANRVSISSLAWAGYDIQLSDASLRAGVSRRRQVWIEYLFFSKGASRLSAGVIFTSDHIKKSYDRLYVGTPLSYSFIIDGGGVNLPIPSLGLSARFRHFFAPHMAFNLRMAASGSFSSNYELTMHDPYMQQPYRKMFPIKYNNFSLLAGIGYSFFREFNPKSKP